LRDILTTLKRRNPSIQVVVYPVMVQGDGAAAQIAEALLVAGRRAECDVLIVARGGGSIEDLWAFNEERVARAIRACTIPVVSGVGHETDVTIADLAADRRAPTPTAAAEMVSPDGAALQLHVAALARRLCDNAARDLEYRMQRLDMLTKSLEHPRHRLELQLERIRGLRNRLAAAWIARRDAQQWRLAALLHRMHARLPRPADRQLLVRRAAERLSSTIKGRLSACESMTAALASSLDHLSPQRVLSRGYSVVRDARGVIVRNAATLAGGDELDITLASGGARARVEQTR
jgi:exodeoxyribonuclease VII large subunit